MSSNAPHSSMRRYVIAAIAAIGCLLPAACDVAAASPGYHNDRPGQGQQGGVTTTAVPGPAPTAPARTARAPPRRRPPSRRTSRATRVKPRARAQVKPRATGPGRTGPGQPGRRPGERSSVAPTVDASATVVATVAPAAGANNGLDVLARDCSKSKLSRTTASRRRPPASRPRSARSLRQDNDPSLLITDSPRFVRPNTAFTLKVSTRNLIRDRFLGAAVGGYYLESSVLTERHPARPLPHRLPDAVQPAVGARSRPGARLLRGDAGQRRWRHPGHRDGQRRRACPTRGIAQCAVWAGDGSHRIPMMERANQTPAFDAVRILVG